MKTSDVVIVVLVIIAASISQKDTQDEIKGGGGGGRMQIDVVEGADKELNPLPLLEDDGEKDVCIWDGNGLQHHWAILTRPL